MANNLHYARLYDAAIGRDLWLELTTAKTIGASTPRLDKLRLVGTQGLIGAVSVNNDLERAARQLQPALTKTA